jgi:hypothetical protein
MSAIEKTASSELRQRVLSSDPRQKAICRKLRKGGRKPAASVFRRIQAYGCNITHAVTDIETRAGFDTIAEAAYYSHLADVIDRYGEGRASGTIEEATVGIIVSMIETAAALSGKTEGHVMGWIHPIDREFISEWGEHGSN